MKETVRNPVWLALCALLPAFAPEAVFPVRLNAGPVSADSLHALAVGALDSGDERGALRLLDRALEISPGHGGALLERGRLCLALGRLNEARTDLRSASFDPDRGIRLSARLALGDLERRYGFRGLQAARQYRLALSLDPTSREAYYSLAETGVELGETQGWRMAARALADLLCLDPEYRDAHSFWRERIKDRSDDDLRRVNACLESHITLRPERSAWWLDIALDRHRLGEHAAAREALENHARLAPDDRVSSRALLSARLSLELGDSAAFARGYAEALEYAEQSGDFLDLFRTAEPVFSLEESRRWAELETAAERASFFRGFWLRRDPDPFDSVNIRLIDHFTRLSRVERDYRLINPHSRFNTSRDYHRLVSPSSSLYEYDSDLFWDRCRGLVLDQRGLLMIRHGPPDRIRRELSWKDPIEIWHYGPVRFVFELRKGAGDFVHVPAAGSGVGDIKKAMESESFRDPVPGFPQDYYVVDFRGPDGNVELDFYQSAPAATFSPDSVPEAAVALYDSLWVELGRDRRASLTAETSGDNIWIGISRVSAAPGRYFYAARFGLPGRRVVDRGSLEIKPYSGESFELSSLVLGSVPAPGKGLLTRRSVELLPRPSLRFRRGEIIHVFLEVYGLTAGPDGGGSFREWVTVGRAEKEDGGWIEGLKRLFGGGRTRSNLILTFDRTLTGDDFPASESFTVDTAPLAPGDYRILIEARDNATGRQVSRKAFFEIVGKQVAAGDPRMKE